MKRVIMLTVMILCLLIVSTTPFWTSGCSRAEGESGNIISRPHVSAKTEAETLAKEWVNARFLRHKGSWYTIFPSGFMHQFKNVRYDVDSDELSEADKLNSIEWKGSICYTCGVRRSYYARDHFGKKKDWQEWENCSYEPIIAFILVKKVGSWQLRSFMGYEDHTKLIKPTMSAIPKG
jgi:hypothetical protein